MLIQHLWEHGMVEWVNLKWEGKKQAHTLNIILHITMHVHKLLIMMICFSSSPFPCSSNYGPTIRVQTLAEKEKNCDQVLWLYGEDRQVCKTSFTWYHKKLTFPFNSWQRLALWIYLCIGLMKMEVSWLFGLSIFIIINRSWDSHTSFEWYHIAWSDKGLFTYTGKDMGKREGRIYIVLREEDYVMVLV